MIVALCTPHREVSLMSQTRKKGKELSPQCALLIYGNEGIYGATSSDQRRSVRQHIAFHHKR